ncbi:MAG: 23S rRNA pseudouridine1911/1915/1917 synthase [Limisphaerales bacterium]|jgi:23S rRNA pseudouridine1911/1915/1917 synthase
MSDRSDTHTVEFSRPRERLDQYLGGVFQAVSRGTIQRLIKEGHITVDGESVKPKHTPKAGEVVVVSWPDVRPSIPEPEDIPLDVLFEDQDLLVINKPPGLCVHPGNGHETGTLVHALLHHCKGDLSGIGGVARPGIVHRLDLDTSGCIVVAKNDPTHIELCRQFADRETRKVYHAIVCSQLTRLAGEIRAAISRHPTHRKRMAALDDDEGKQAHTSYRRLRQLNHASLAEAIIHTGRTHQIRVHFQYLGHPILGDAMYGRNRNTQIQHLNGYDPPRQMLHSFRLGFTHPTSGEVIECEAPWPDDFKATLKALELPETLHA